MDKKIKRTEDRVIRYDNRHKELILNMVETGPITEEGIEIGKSRQVTKQTMSLSGVKLILKRMNATKITVMKNLKNANETIKEIQKQVKKEEIDEEAIKELTKQLNVIKRMGEKAKAEQTVAQATEMLTKLNEDIRQLREHLPQNLK